MEVCQSAEAPVPSTTWTTKANEPAADGVPEIVPPELRPSPGGSDPALVDHVYGSDPPPAWIVNEKGTRSVASGRLTLEMLSCEETTMEHEVLADAPLPSTT